jgi:translocator protein
MIERPWLLPAMLAALTATAVALVGTTITTLGPWYWGLQQPPWAPPTPAYGAAWTAIYALAALAAVTAWRAAESREEATRLIGLFALNGFLNIAWSLIFFRLERPDWALAELILLWLSVAHLTLACGRRSRAAALMLLPYLAWVSFAGMLNWEVMRLNGPFG